MSAAAKTEWHGEIAGLIGEALALGKAGKRAEAIETFHRCRMRLTEAAPRDLLQKQLVNNAAGGRKEADRVRSALLKLSDKDAKTRIAIFGDSLGLPRPEEMADFDRAIQTTYAGLILSRLKGRDALRGVSVDSHCQRFFTTDDLLDLLDERPDALKDAHVLVHLGLNDCAVRMFLTAQRLALNLVPKELSEQIVGFSRTYRHDIVRAYPDFSYVPLEKFRANLERLHERAQAAGCRSLTFSTVIVVPMKFWHGTPNICQNFTRYNLTVMTLAMEQGNYTLDVDRLMWQSDNAMSLNKDGMHLSSYGHDLLASAWLKSVFNI